MANLGNVLGAAVLLARVHPFSCRSHQQIDGVTLALYQLDYHLPLSRLAAVMADEAGPGSPSKAAQRLDHAARVQTCDGKYIPVNELEIQASELLQSVLVEDCAETVCVPLTAEALACWRQHLHGSSLDCSGLKLAFKVGIQSA